jgi:hypothetical protein
VNLSPNRWLYVLAAAIIVVILFLSMPVARGPATEVPYSQFKELVARGQVEEVTLRGSDATATLTDLLPLGPGGARTFAVRTRIPAFGDQDLMHLLEREQVEIRTLPEEPSGLSSMIYFLLP